MSGPWQRLRRGRHSAEAIVGDGAREPTADEMRHLAVCPACFAAVRRGRSFDRQLVAAVAELASSPIQSEVLTMPMPSIRRPPAPSLASLGVIAALVVAAGLVTWSVLPSPQGAASARPTPEAEPHLVVAEGATWQITLAGRSLEVDRRTGGPSDNGKPEHLASWDLGEFVNGVSAGSLRCPRSQGGWQWAAFGHQNDLEPLTYSGPPAAWTWAPDGVWLVVLDMTRFDPSAAVEMKAGKRPVSGVSNFSPHPSDIRQPSGCYILG